MRTLTKIAFAAVAALALAAMLMPAEAACGGNPLIKTRVGASQTANAASFVFNPATFAASYFYSPTYGVFPPFARYATPWSANATAMFWAVGTGDPLLGPGDDSGTFNFPTYPWMYYAPTYYNPTYYGNYAGEIFLGWGNSEAIDGCLQTNEVGNCTCLLIEDNDGATGYFAMASAYASPPAWNSDLIQPGNDPAGNFAGITLAPIPPPTILGAARKASSLDLNITVTVPTLTTPAQGVHHSQGSSACACGPTGYKVMQAIVLRGAPAPTTRDVTAWSPMTLVADLDSDGFGDTQPFTSLGTSVAVESLCGSADQDVLITTQLEFDSGFTSSIVSGDATRIECGPNIAEPVRPRVRPGDIRPPARQPRRSR
jgi:hypothetical protein